MTEGPRRRAFTVADMARLVYVAGPALAPDGSEVAYVEHRPDPEGGRPRPRILRVAATGGPARPLLADPEAVGDRPAWSPDGRHLAYLAPGASTVQLWLVPRDGSAPPRKLTSARHGVEDFLWSPDGRRIAFVTRLWPEEGEEALSSEMAADERAAFLAELARRPKVAEELMYKFDETHGFWDGSLPRIALLDLATGRARLLDTAGLAAKAPAWSPDGRVLVHARFPYRHHLATRRELFATEVETGETVQLTSGAQPIHPREAAVTSTHAVFLAWLAEGDTSVPYLFRVPLSGGEREFLGPPEEAGHGVGAVVVGRSEQGWVPPPVRVAGDFLYFTSLSRGRIHLFRAPLDRPEAVEPVVRRAGVVRSFAGPAGGRLAYTFGDPSSPDELYLLEIDSGETRRLSSANPWLGEIEVAPLSELSAPTRDGQATVHGWVALPTGSAAGPGEAGRRSPVVLYIHGGPQAAWVESFWHEVQALAGAGFAVLLPNARGSVGYGGEYAKDSHGFGDAAVEDFHAFVDEAVRRHPGLDPERVGVTGGSYGGYMTIKLLGRGDGRFRAGVAQRLLANPATSYGTGDMGFVSQLREKPKSFKDYMLDRARRALVGDVDKMKAPLLLLHGLDDVRCTPEQAEQVFVAMRERNPEVPVRMVLFPG
ncbi:MAG: S9 family peptidase, partial [Clostridia bacterium]|nr:S9 family peptidase [Clostridia bacterium]